MVLVPVPVLESVSVPVLVPVPVLKCVSVLVPVLKKVSVPVLVLSKIQSVLFGSGSGSPPLT